MAHRGAAAEAPENTLEAFDLAVEAGCDAIELDVQRARDGTPVVIHDATLDRTTDARGPVGERSVAELALLAVPTLEEVLGRYPELPMTVDVKDPGATGAVVALVRRLGRVERTVLYVEDGTDLPSFRHYPGRRATSTRQAVRMAALYSWHPALVPRGFPEVLHTPLRRGPLRLVSPRVVRAAHRAGRTVQAWTVNEPDVLRRLSGWGVDAVVTDDPRGAARTLRP